TVVASDDAGLTAEASVTVTRTAPIPTPAPQPQPQPQPRPQPGAGDVPRCTVPRVKRGSTVKAARAALKDARCKVASKTRSRRSTKVKKGRVISLSRRAGDFVHTKEAIVLTVSAGRKARGS